MNSDFEQESYDRTFKNTLNEMRKSKIGTDVTIVCGEKQFPAHKIILSAGSSYFRKMFESNFKESSSDQVAMPSIEANVMALILDYMYFSYRERESSSNIVITAILKAGHLLDIPDLCDYCWHKLLGKMNVKTYSHLWNMALLYEKESVVETVLDFVVSHLYDVMKGQAFHDLTASQLENLVKKIETLRMPMETFVMERIINWVRNDEAERAQHLKNLIAHLDISTLPQKYLKDLMKTEPLITEDEGLRFVMNKKLSEKMYSHTREEYALMQSHQLLRFLNHYNHSKYQCIDLVTGEKSEDSLSFPLALGMSCAQYENFIYFVGGQSIEGSPQSKTLVQFCLETNTAEYLTPLPKPVTFAHVCVVESILYVVGGTESDPSSGKRWESIQYFNIRNQKWNDMSLPNKVLKVKLCACLDKALYILCEKDENCFQLYKVNEKMKCEFESEMPYAFSMNSFLSASYNDTLYGLVNCRNENLLCMYNCRTKAWTTRYFHGNIPHFIYCAMSIGDEFCLVCIEKEKIKVLNSKENKVKPLMMNSTCDVGFYDDVPIDMDPTSVVLNLGYLKPSTIQGTKNYQRFILTKFFENINKEEMELLQKHIDNGNYQNFKSFSIFS